MYRNTVLARAIAQKRNYTAYIYIRTYREAVQLEARLDDMPRGPASNGVLFGGKSDILLC